MAGVTTEGFVPSTDDEIQAALESAWRAALGPAVNVSPESRNGQQIAAFQNALAQGWQLGAAFFNAFGNPGGVLLDYISALTNTLRLPATPSTAVLTLTGTPTTVVPSGKVAAVNGSTAQFATTKDATIAAAGAWAVGTSYAVGARVTANGNIYLAAVGGVSASSGTGPAGTGNAIVDAAVQWNFVGAGIGAIDVPAACTVTGPMQGYSGTITIISTPVSGWSGVYNALDAVPGTNIEQDPQLRVRRATEAAGQGRTPLNAMRAQLLRPVDEGGAGATSVVIFENTSDATVDGIPPHSIQILIEGGLDADIAQCIFDNKCGGLATYGNTTISVVDTEGIGHSIGYSRTSDVDAYVAGTVVIDPESFPVDGLSQCADAIAAAGNALGQGRDAYARALGGALFAKDADGAQLIPGVLDVTGFVIGTTSTPIDRSLPISVAQHSRFDTSRIALTTSIGSV